MKILIVEDSATQAELLESLLKTGRYAAQVEKADSIAEAAKALKQERYDVVLLDLGLPDSVGIETVTTVRKLSWATPIVVITGDDRREVMLDCIRAGAIDFIPKAKLEEERIYDALGIAQKKRFENEKVERPVNKMLKSLQEFDKRLRGLNADHALSR